MHSLDELIRVLQSFPLKNGELSEESALNESIDLFGSLMLQRVRSTLAEHFPDSDLEGLTERSNIGEILRILNRNCGSQDNRFTHEEPLESKYTEVDSNQIQAITTNKECKDQVVAVGIDIESINAFPSDVMLPSGAAFRSRIFSPKEIAYASTKHSPIQTLLGIFCAKEAVIKCYGGHKRLAFRDITITHDSKGRPVCNVGEHKGFEFKVSISHSAEYSCAFALMTHAAS